MNDMPMWQVVLVLIVLIAGIYMIPWGLFSVSDILAILIRRYVKSRRK